MNDVSHKCLWFDTYFSTGHKRRNPAIPKPALCGGDLGKCAEEHTGHLAGQGYCGRGQLADDDADGGCGWVTVV